MTKPIVEIRNLSKKFKDSDTRAVDDVSISINSNEVFGLLGPNGAGKTTLISMLCGLFQPSDGQIIIDGIDISHDIKAIKQLIGVVPQDIALYPTLTAKENLDFYGAMYGIPKKELNTRIDHWLDKLGLTQAKDKKVSKFSGGMKRRVNLIASILHEPKILFLDEPTVGIDVQSRAVIMEHLRELNSKGMTIIYTSHHLEEAESFCSHLAIIDYGKILCEDSPKALISSTPDCNNLEDVFLHYTKRKLRD